MALSVMIYHYVSMYIPEEALGGEYLLGKLGVYAVSIFYILSGLSLALVYEGRLSTVDDAKDFAIKRVFRIFPLYWLAITVAIIYRLAVSYLNNEPLSIPLSDFVLNYTLLFGFVSPGAYLTTGAWSIGNEMVFYAILPMVFMLTCHFKRIIPMVFASSCVIAYFFAFEFLDPTSSLASQWLTYINPFNQLFLFMGGVCVGIYAHRAQALIISNNYWFLLMIASFALFYFLPAQGDKITIVAGSSRVLFSIACILFVSSVYLINPSFSAIPAKILGFLGEASYSIYLLHPLVAVPLVILFDHIGIEKWVALVSSFLLTLLVGGLSYKYLEKPMMGVGRRFIRYRKIRDNNRVPAAD
jgi:exopolysaccharide production protein ExoZ